MVPKVLKVFKEPLEFRVYQVNKVFKELLENKEFKVFRVVKEHKELLELGRKVLRVYKVLREI